MRARGEREPAREGERVAGRRRVVEGDDQIAVHGRGPLGPRVRKRPVVRPRVERTSAATDGGDRRAGTARFARLCDAGASHDRRYEDRAGRSRSGLACWGTGRVGGGRSVLSLRFAASARTCPVRSGPPGSAGALTSERERLLMGVVSRVRKLTVAVVVALAVTASPAAAAHVGDVAALQVALRARGVYVGSVDGIAGPATTAAVRAVQRQAGITVDGVAGPATRRALGWRGRPPLE